MTLMRTFEQVLTNKYTTSPKDTSMYFGPKGVQIEELLHCNDTPTLTARVTLSLTATIAN